VEWIETLNKTIGYIESNLTEEIDYDKLARIALCSSYQFQRMFSYIAGVPLSDYIRRRKMSLVAVDLQTGNEKIIDVALKYGYSSPTAFNRAFQSVHGVAPSKIKKNNAMLKSFPLLNFKLIAKGVEAMEFRIEQKEMIRVLGVSTKLSKDLSQAYDECEALWVKVLFEMDKEGNVVELGKICDELNAAINAPYPDGSPHIAKNNGFFGIEFEHNDGGEYVVAVESPAPASGSLKEYFIPKHTWAVFAGKNFFAEENNNAESATALEEKLYSEWLPTSGYEIADTMQIQLLLPTSDLENAPFETWLPVKKK